MPRAKADPKQETFAWRLYEDGNGPTAILEQLRQNFEEPVSIRTVANWVSRFKEFSGTEKEKPFEWLTMEHYDIPWESSAFLMDMWKFDRDHKPFPYDNIELFSPTIRQVQWWWRVHQAIPELCKFDIWHIGQKFTARDILAEVMQSDIGSTDLQAYLAYRPWENSDYYEISLQNHMIPDLLTRQDLLKFITTQNNWTPQCFHQFNLCLATEIWNYERPLALPSENALKITFSGDYDAHNSAVEKRLEVDLSRPYRYHPVRYGPDF